jgi:hypothetical protein
MNKIHLFNITYFCKEIIILFYFMYFDLIWFAINSESAKSRV